MATFFFAHASARIRATQKDKVAKLRGSTVGHWPAFKRSQEAFQVELGQFRQDPRFRGSGSLRYISSSPISGSRIPTPTQKFNKFREKVNQVRVFSLQSGDSCSNRCSPGFLRVSRGFISQMENPKVRVSPPESGKSYTSAGIVTPTPQFVEFFVFFNNSGFREATGSYYVSK